MFIDNKTCWSLVSRGGVSGSIPS